MGRSVADAAAVFPVSGVARIHARTSSPVCGQPSDPGRVVAGSPSDVRNHNSDHGDFSAADIVECSANRQFLLLYQIAQNRRSLRSTDACSVAFCRLAVVRSPLAPAIAGWMY